MKKETLSMLSGCAAFAMVFSLGAPMAQAAAGNIDNARINGSWNYRGQNLLRVYGRGNLHIQGMRRRAKTVFASPDIRRNVYNQRLL